VSYATRAMISPVLRGERAVTSADDDFFCRVVLDDDEDWGVEADADDAASPARSASPPPTPAAVEAASAVVVALTAVEVVVAVVAVVGVVVVVDAVVVGVDRPVSVSPLLARPTLGVSAALLSSSTSFPIVSISSLPPAATSAAVL
jgi:hypothetical protein